MGNDYGIRQICGALLFDVHRYIWRMFLGIQSDRTPSWVFIRNRDEELNAALNSLGVSCNWQWTSDLYLPKVFPVFGRWLYRCALRDFPIVLQGQLAEHGAGKPDVSFIIGHRGLERLPHLLATLQSIAGQKDCRVECIVVEQDNDRLVEKHLPPWVHYIHTPLPEKDMAYSRAWAFNAGARVAEAELLVFHDNDLLVPAAYARELFTYYRDGYEVINLKRFIFYFDKNSTESVCRESRADISPIIDTVMQNAQGGGSICVSRQAYFDIGGFDERFVGWGGEDNEFWERAQTRKVYPYGYLPLVHLWHAPQPGKKSPSDASGVLLYQKLCELPVQERIRNLRAIQ